MCDVHLHEEQRSVSLHRKTNSNRCLDMLKNDVIPQLEKCAVIFQQEGAHRILIMLCGNTAKGAVGLKDVYK
jgi:hypothetical protein